MKRPFWRYGLFQIPAIFLTLFVLATGISYFLNSRLGCANGWLVLFSGLSWIALAWVLVMPLDLFLRSVLKLSMSLAGRLSLLNAIFWAVLTSVILASTLPATWNQCTALNWAQWHANIWNEMFLEAPTSAPIGSRVEFRFVVSDQGDISSVTITQSDSNELENYVRERIEAIEGSEVLDFIPNTRRKEMLHESSITICEGGRRGCGDPADPRDYSDLERL